MRTKAQSAATCLLMVLAAGTACGQMPARAAAQRGPALQQIHLPPHGVPLKLDTGVVSGDGAAERQAFEQTLTVPGAAALRVYLAEWHLGDGSYILLTSLADGAQQRLDAGDLSAWRGASAFFNGDAVHLSLHVAPHDTDVFVSLAGVTGQPPASAPAGPPVERTLCGADNRVASGDSRVCRIAKDTGGVDPLAWCTGWQISNGAVLTAGHCVDSDPSGCDPPGPDGIVQADFLAGVVQFDVPLSDCDGTPNHPGPEDQYPIDGVFDFQFTGDCDTVGRDWAVFSVLPNGADVAHVSRGFFRVTTNLPDSLESVRVTGFGIDEIPAGCVAPQNEASQTNQTQSGPFLFETPSIDTTVLSYQVDTEPGNSGSPVIWIAENLTIGIHTAGGCTGGGGANVGTSFEHDPLEDAVNDFVGINVAYVDGAHPFPHFAGVNDNTVFTPDLLVSLGVLATPTGGTLMIVEGSYNEALTLNQAMTIRAPVGTVVIGQ